MMSGRHSGYKKPRYERKFTCVYCERILPEDLHHRHRFEKHFDLQFKCPTCVETVSTLQMGHYAFLSQLKSHLVKYHSMSNALEKTNEELVEAGSIIVPSDLRSISCRLCDAGQKVLLAQDRLAMSAHIKHRHELNIPRHVLKYQCRVCEGDFASSEQLIKNEHACVKFSRSRCGETMDEKLPALVDDLLDQKKGEQCLYCEQAFMPDNRASHRGKHWDLDFQCAKCTRAFPLLEEIRQHLASEHEWKPDGCDARQLADLGWLIMPRDLRSLACPCCQRLFLGQSRSKALFHLKKEHPNVEARDLSYECRSCSKGFAASADIFNHPCAKSSKSEQSGLDETGEKILPLQDIVWGGDTYVSGDLRRMACRLCAAQINGNRFFAMVRHLEQNHDKFQQCRSYVLESFVKFGCSHCQSFCPDSVHLWDKHFVNDACTKCKGSVAEPSPATPAAKAPNEDEEDDNLLIEENDIRCITCKICMTRFEKCGFDVLQAHLRTTHAKETIKSPVLASFVVFGCLECPSFCPDTLSSWKEHFFCRNTTCIPSHVRAVEEAHIAEEESERLSAEDCRKLSCRVCNFKAADFFVICRHLEEAHDVDTKPSNMAFVDLIRFGCRRCPNFEPLDRKRWSRHFSSDFSFCQGSAEVPYLSPDGRTRVLFWCDACQETREDIEQHFQGSNHVIAITTLRAKDASKVVDCTLCFLGFSTEANRLLHHKLAHVTPSSHKTEMIHAAQSKTDIDMM